MNDLYMGYEQQKSIEDVIKYLHEQKQPKLIAPILDLMRMSENWYGRLDELRRVHGFIDTGEPKL